MHQKRHVIGLCGSHRVGKTTLAQAIAQQSDWVFVQTHTSQVFAKHGLSPSESLDFKTRLWIQHQVLDAAVAEWQAQPHSFVTDRTPIDFIAYTLADIQGHTVVDFAALEMYINACLQATREHFTALIAMQPAIPLVFEAGKAALNQAYIEHLNTVVLGLCHDERLQCPVHVMPRPLIDLQARVEFVLSTAQ